MNTVRLTMLLGGLALASAGLAQEAKPWRVPAVDQLPDDAYGRLVRQGKRLAEQTYQLIGPEAPDPNKRYAGNNLACSSCHLEGATRKFAMPWIGVYATFPLYRAREDQVSTIEERINGCMERSMNGRKLPLDSDEMKDRKSVV